MTQAAEEQRTKPHYPFLARQIIFWSGLGVAFVVCFLMFFHKQAFWMAAASYCGTVFALDLIFFLAKIRFDRFLDPVQLGLSEGVTLDQMKRYQHSRSYIRFASFLTASLACFAGFFWNFPLGMFVGTYLLSTLLGIIGVRLFSSLVFPKTFQIRPLKEEELDSEIPHSTALDLAYKTTGRMDIQALSSAPSETLSSRFPLH